MARQQRIYRVEAIFTGDLSTAELRRIPGVCEPRIDDHHLTCAVRGSVAPLLASLFDAGIIEFSSRELARDEPEPASPAAR